MGSRKVVLLLMVFLAVCTVTCRPFDDDMGEDAKEKAEEAKKFASDVLQNAEEKTRTFSDWTQDKYMMDNVEDVATSAAGRMKSAASGASDYAMGAVSGAMAQGKEKIDEHAKVIKMPTDMDNAKETMRETVGQAREKIGDTYDSAKENIQRASDKASSVAHDVKDRAGNAYEEGKQKMNLASEKFSDDKASEVYDESRDKGKGAMDCGNMVVDGFDEVNDSKDNIGVGNEYGRDKIAETFDQAKRAVEEAYESAKNTMTQEAKAKYEAAKEKASDAAGYVGAKMRNTPNQ